MRIKTLCLCAFAAIGIAAPALAGNQVLLSPSPATWDFANAGPLTNFFGIFALPNTYTNSGGSPLPFLVTPNARPVCLGISFDYCNTNAAGQTYVARFSSSLDMAHWATNSLVCNIAVPQGTNTEAWSTNFDSFGIPFYALTSFESTNANTVAGYYTNGFLSSFAGVTATNAVPVVDYTNLAVSGNIKPLRPFKLN